MHHDGLYIWFDGTHDESQVLPDDTEYIQGCVDHGVQPLPGTYRITRLISVGTLKLVEID